MLHRWFRSKKNVTPLV